LNKKDTNLSQSRTFCIVFSNFQFKKKKSVFITTIFCKHLPENRNSYFKHCFHIDLFKLYI